VNPGGWNLLGGSMAPISIYFGRTTVNEESAYFPARDEFLDWLVAEGPAVPKVREVLYTCRSMHGVDLFSLMRRDYDPNVFYGGRPFQVAMFVAVAYFFEELFRPTIASVGFYSAGASSSYVFSDVFSLATYFEKVVPFQVQVRRAMEETGERFPLREVMIEGEAGDEIESYVATIVRRHKLFDRIFLKDRRRPNAVHLAGYADDLAAVRDMIWKQFPGSGKSGGTLHPAIGAHVPLYDRRPIDSILDSVAFNPPRFPLVTIRGEQLSRGSDDQDLLRRHYADASQGPMDSGAAFDALAGAGREIVVVGTPFGAKVLRRLELAPYPVPRLAAEIMLERRGARCRSEVAKE
jgi:hypothetical protein